MCTCLCLFLGINTFAVIFSVASDFNTYIQVYDSMGGIVAADFIVEDKVIQANTIFKLDRVRWLGSDRSIYEYRFDDSMNTQNCAIRFHKNGTFSVGKLESGGTVTFVSQPQESFYLLYK